MKKAIAYLRVSTEEQADKGFSIQAQREECIKKALELGCNIENIMIFSDEGVSGAVLERPQLMASLELMKKGGINYFITMDTSRLSRNVSQHLILIDEIKRCGTELIFLRNSFKDNPEGRFQITIMAAVDEYERARLRLRTEMGKRAKAKQHLLTHNPGIYGYNFDIKTDCLYINEEQANIVKLMYHWFIEEDMGPSEICSILNEMGIQSPRGKLWSRVTVRRMLANESYTGILYIRRFDTREYHLNKYKKRSEKVKVVERPRNEWIDIKIPQIIEKGIWQKAQEKLNEYKRTTRRSSIKEEYMLSSIMRCAECGSYLNGKLVRSRDKDYRYYICPARNKKAENKNCSLKTINSEKIEERIWAVIKGRILNKATNNMNLKKIIEKVKKNIGKKTELLSYEIENANKEASRIITLFQKGYINEEEMKNRLDKLNDKITLLRNRGENIGYELDSRRKKLYKMINEKNIYNIIESILKEMDNTGKNHIIKISVKEIVVSSNSITIKSRF